MLQALFLWFNFYPALFINLNLPGTLWATSACCGRPLLLFDGGECSVPQPCHCTSRERACGKLRSECGGTRWRTGGEMRGKLANGVGSQYSHTTSKRGVSSITNADAHTSAANSRLNWLPRRFKRTRPFRRKTKCGFCACAIRFRTSSTCE